MLTRDFRELLSAFIAEQVEYLVVGGYAMAAHGHPRTTGDLDLWVRCSDDNARRVWTALAKFGAPVGDTPPAFFAQPDQVFQMGLPPNRIDVITSIEAVTFDEAWPARHIAVVDGLHAAVIGVAHLLKNKQAVGRPKDLADVATLKLLEAYRRAQAGPG